MITAIILHMLVMFTLVMYLVSLPFDSKSAYVINKLLGIVFASGMMLIGLQVILVLNFGG